MNGFILQVTYRTESGRPVIHLMGCLETGGSFLVRETRQVPHFFVKEEEAERAQETLALTPIKTDRVTLGEKSPVVRFEFPRPGDSRPFAEQLSDVGIQSYEADLRFGVRYLIDRGVQGSVRIRGSRKNSEGSGDPGAERTNELLVFEDPELESGEWVPRLRVLSIDIETDPTASRLLSIGLYGCGVAEVFLLCEDSDQACPEPAIRCESERDLLLRFCERVRDVDPDVLTGWNVIEFDLAVLLRIASRVRTTLELGRFPGEVRLPPPRSRREMPRAQVPGRVVLDGIQLLRGSFLRMESYGLDKVAKAVLGEGKTLSHGDRGAEILRLFREDRGRFVEYNLTDCRLVLEILDKLDLIELAVERCRLTGMTPDRVTASIASFDFLYLSELHRRGMVAESVGTIENADAGTSGGHVLEPVPGLHPYVLALDFKSLYPSLIRTFQVDPLGFRSTVPDEDLIIAPNGAGFLREKGILTGILDELFPRREAAKKAGNRAASQAIKILMNSFYGVLASPACRFSDSDLANAITSFGREILLWTKKRMEDLGHRVLYGDTDSLFVLSGASSAEEARRVGETLVVKVNRDIARHILETWKVESRLDLEFETLYLRLVLTEVRHGGAGARKRYAGLVDDGGKGEVVFTGLEAVRRDWTDLARKVQRELYRRLFFDEPVDGYLKQILSDLKGGRLNDLLVYRKSLRKHPDAYTRTTPPHVAAARKMTGKPGRTIKYVMTVAGPEPADERKSPLDLPHYIQKQVRPVAEPVLALLDLDFDHVLTGHRQMRLF